MVIGITEVKPKNSKNILNPAEFNLEWTNEYNMFYTNIDNNIGRGLILYVDKSVHAEEVKLESTFQENIFVKIKTNKQEQILIGLVYRSPSDTTIENNRDLCNLVTEALNI